MSTNVIAAMCAKSARELSANRTGIYSEEMGVGETHPHNHVRVGDSCIAINSRLVGNPKQNSNWLHVDSSAGER